MIVEQQLESCAPLPVRAIYNRITSCEARVAIAGLTVQRWVVVP